MGKITGLAKLALMCLLCISIAFISGCTDTFKADIAAYGKEGHIKCYSGGQMIYEGDSTGKLQTVSNSDGWEFKDKKTGKFIRVSGDCVIEQ